MSRKDPQKRPSTLLGYALKTYLDTHQGVTHEKLAELLDVDPKTISRWKSGETIITDPYELKRIADRLALSYESLAIPAAIYAPLTAEQIEETVSQVWTKTNQAFITDARSMAENLIRQLRQQNGVNDPLFLRAVTQAYNAAAYTTCINVRTPQVQQSIDYFQQMEHFARLLGDDTLINIALTYQGDMLRRRKDISQAIEYLERARNTTPQADVSARGNCIQLLGRAYFQAEREQDFFNVMAEAEDLALALSQQRTKSVERYDLTTVYEEYARSYSRLGKEQKALDYLEQAEKVKTPTKITEMLLSIARAEILIHAGDISNGEALAIQAARECKERGHQRQLERLYALKRFMNRQAFDFGKAERALSEVLDGPIEF